MLKTILVDDERPALKALEYQLKQYKDIYIAGLFTDIVKALEKIEKEIIHIVFLDIEMPKMKGIQAAEKILAINSNIQIVFTTAHHDYAVDAFNVDAVDYIMKPVLKRRLDRTIERIRKRYSLASQMNHDKEVNKILCFGNFEWINNSEPVKWRTSKTKELIAYLVHHRDEFIHRDKIIESLWTDKEMEKAVKLLHTSIYNIRKALKSIGIEDGIIYSDEMYRLNVPNIYCDIYEFNEMTNREIEIKAENVKEFERIVGLYRDDYFEGNDYLWVKDERERLKYLYIDVLRKIAENYIDQKEYNQAILYLKKILEKDYYIDEVHRMLLEVYKNKGDHKAYNEHYSKAKKSFNDELGIELSF